MVRLTNWNILRINDLRGNFIILNGNAYGHNFLGEGKYIFTSILKSLEIDSVNKLIIAHTQNTKYSLALSKMNSDNQNNRIFKLDEDDIPLLTNESKAVYLAYTEIINFLNVDLYSSVDSQIVKLNNYVDSELLTYWLKKFLSYRSKRIQLIEGLFDRERDIDLIFFFSDSANYYYDIKAIRQDDKIEMSKLDLARVHVGNFQDSVITRHEIDEIHYDIRYFPYSGNKLSFYRIMSRSLGTGERSKQPIKFAIYNSGKNCFEIGSNWGSYEVEPGELRVIIENDSNANDKLISGSDLYPATINVNDVIKIINENERERSRIMMPKFKENQYVHFRINNDILYGCIKIVDRYGTWEQSKEVSYDIYIEEENMLWKHVVESLIVELDDEI